jgi:hypothetical protein
MPIDDRDPEARRLRQTILNLAAAYEGGRDTYQHELNRVVDTHMAEVERSGELKLLLATTLHSGVVVTYAALSTISEAWFDGDFADATNALEDAIEKTIDQASDELG